MKTFFILLTAVLTLASCASPAPEAKDKPVQEVVIARCDGCGRAIKCPQDKRGEMCSMCDWRLGANIGWP